MGTREIAYADSLGKKATSLFNDNGYVIIRGLLDTEKDIRPVREEYERLLDSLTQRWYEDGEISSLHEGLPFGRGSAPRLRNAEQFAGEGAALRADPATSRSWRTLPVWRARGVRRRDRLGGPRRAPLRGGGGSPGGELESKP